MTSYDFLSDRDWRRNVLQTAFGRSFQAFVGFAILMGILCYYLRGRDVFLASLHDEFLLISSLLVRAGTALAIAAIIWAILPRDKVAALLGSESGIRGLFIALLVGMVMPGGPSSAYALLGVLSVSGADRGALVTFITAWAFLGIQRIVIWDIPFMGADFAILRFASSCLLPLLAGLIARRISWPLNFPDAGEMGAGK